MTGQEQGNQQFDDEDLRDDDGFVLDGTADELDATFEAVEREVTQGDKRPLADVTDPEDVLFTPHRTATDGQEAVTFSERDRSGWAGAGMSADEIGIQSESQSALSESGDAVQEVDLDQDQEIALEEEPMAIVDEDQASGLELEDGGGDAEFDSTAPESLQLEEDAQELQHVASGESEPEGDWAPVGSSSTTNSGVREVTLSGNVDAHVSAEEELPVPDSYEDEGQGSDAEVETETEAETEAETEVGAESDLDADSEPVESQPMVAAAATPVLVPAQRSNTSDAPRGRFVRIAASLVAATLVAGAGVAWWQPEWIGLHHEPEVIESTPVARPNVDIDLPPPDPQVDPQDPTSDPTDPTTSSMPSDPTTDPRPDPDTGTKDPTVADPVSGTGDPSNPGNPGNTDPKDPGSNPATDPVADPVMDPVEPTDPQIPVGVEVPNAQVGHTDTPQTGAPSPEPRNLVPIGDTIRVGTVEAPTPPATTAVPAIASGLVIGSQAVAQLRNGNFFVGVVKVVEGNDLTLRLEKGEVTLAIPELQNITQVDGREFAELKKVERAYVRLNNKNRLTGSVLKALRDELMVLETKGSRVVIPRSDIEEVGTVSNRGFRVTDEDDEWLRTVVERRLEGIEPDAPNQPRTVQPAPKPGAEPAAKPSK